MTTKLEKIRARVDNPPHWCEYAGLGLDADIPALLAVVEAAMKYRAAVDAYANARGQRMEYAVQAQRRREMEWMAQDILNALVALEGEE